MTRGPRVLVSIAATVSAIAALSAIAAPAAGAPAGESAAKLLTERVGPAMVRIRAVISISATFQGNSNESEQEGEFVSVVVDPSGLLMGASPLQAVRALEGAFPGLSVKLDIKSIKARVPGEAKDRDAVMVVQDASLGLAFAQIVDVTGLTLSAVDVVGGRPPALDEVLYGVGRKGREFDDALTVDRVRVAGFAEQPRRFSIVRGDFDEAGLPLFHADGTLAGIVAPIVGVGGSTGRPEMMQGLLPLEPVRATLAQARKRAAAAVEKAKADAEKAAEETPAGEKPKDGTPDGEKPPEPAPATPPKEPSTPR